MNTRTRYAFRMSVREELIVEGDPHRLNRLLVHIFLGVFIGRNYNSAPETRLFGMAG